MLNSVDKAKNLRFDKWVKKQRVKAVISTLAELKKRISLCFGVINFDIHECVNWYSSVGFISEIEKMFPQCKETKAGETDDFLKSHD